MYVSNSCWENPKYFVHTNKFVGSANITTKVNPVVACLPANDFRIMLDWAETCLPV